MTYIDNNHRYTDPAGYDARSNKLLEKYNKNAWSKLISASAKKHIMPEDIVCDFGCGTLAHFSTMEQAKEIYAIDVNGTMLEVGLRKLSTNQKEKVHPIISDASSTPIPDATCSIIWSIGLTEYTDIDTLFTEMSRISKPRAYMLLQFPRADHPLHILIRILNYLRKKKTKRFRYLSEIRTAARSHGWNVVNVQSTFIRNNLWCILRKSTGE